MARIFLSYDREDAARARQVAHCLEKAGHSLWWDRQITGGAQYSREIERALADADAVVVLWSERSVDSAWVRDEAAAGRDSGRLVPATLDGTAPPLGFRQYQTVDLAGWKGSSRSPAMDSLLHAVGALHAGAAATGAPTSPPPGSPSAPALPRRLILGLVALAAAALSFLAWQRWPDRGTAPVIAVAAADPSPGSQSLARDLLLKLGALQQARADQFRLVEADSTGKADADLIFEAGAGGSGSQVELSLALLRGRDRSLLWSRQFVQPRGQDAHLRQQLAVSGGHVLDCAVQALTDPRADVPPEALKLYLNGCSSFDELAYGELDRMIPVMRDVTRRAPGFAGAWGKLIQAEILTLIAGAGDAGMLGQLRQDIAEARRANPQLAEAYLAEVELLPRHDYAGRLRLIERAIQHNPHHPEPFAARAYYLRSVGRMADGVASAKRGADLNPLSPALLNDYITALGHAGDLKRAEQELARAEQLWPGSSVVADARFRYSLRYGDPLAARPEQQRGATLWAPRMTASFLKARASPTPANVDAAIREAKALTRQQPRAFSLLVQTLGTFGRSDEAFALLASPPANLGRDISETLFRHHVRPLRRDPRFIGVARRLRLVDYWRSSGKWPDFCFEADLPYDCKAEAAKLGA